MIFFLGFEKCEGTILALRKDKIFVETLDAGDIGAVIVDKTNFYAEQGGQIFDTGTLIKVGEVGFLDFLHLSDLSVIVPTSFAFSVMRDEMMSHV